MIPKSVISLLRISPQKESYKTQQRFIKSSEDWLHMIEETFFRIWFKIKQPKNNKHILKPEVFMHILFPLWQMLNQAKPLVLGQIKLLKLFNFCNATLLKVRLCQIIIYQCPQSQKFTYISDLPTKQRSHIMVLRAHWPDCIICFPAAAHLAWIKIKRLLEQVEGCKEGNTIIWISCARMGKLKTCRISGPGMELLICRIEVRALWLSHQNIDCVDSFKSGSLW